MKITAVVDRIENGVKFWRLRTGRISGAGRMVAEEYRRGK